MEQAFRQAEFYESVEDLPFSAFSYELEGSGWHWHNYLELLYGVRGEYMVMVGNQRFPCKSGDFIIINSAEPHATVCQAEGSSLLVIQFDISVIYSPMSAWYETKYLSALFESGVQFQRHTKLTTDSGLQGLLDDIYREHSQRRLGYELSVKAGIIRVFVELLRNKLIDANPEPYRKRQELAKLAPVFQYVQEHYMEEVPQPQMAEMVYMSNTYFSKSFSRATGMRFVDYVHTIRIHEAQKQILTTKKKLTQVADETGFGNVTYFNRIFKRVTGMTPSAYRVQNRIISM